MKKLTSEPGREWWGPLRVASVPREEGKGPVLQVLAQESQEPA